MQNNTSVVDFEDNKPPRTGDKREYRDRENRENRGHLATSHHAATHACLINTTCTPH